MPDRFSRRRFVRDTAAVTTSLTIAARLTGEPSAQAASAATEFSSHWQQTPDRVWIGPEYWANPLQDWRVTGGRLECLRPAADRNVHLLTRQLGTHEGELRMSVVLGRADDQPFGQGAGSAGFRIGIRGPLDDYRNSLLFGGGLDAGITADGQLFIGALPATPPSDARITSSSVKLLLTAVPQANRYRVTLTAADPTSGAKLGEVHHDVSPDRLAGNLALVSNFGQAPRRGNRAANAKTPAAGRFWFADLHLTGSKLTRHDDRAFGPILFSHYTLSRGTLTLTAQMPPVGVEDEQTVRLETQSDGQWRQLATASIHPTARTATFKVERWDDTRDTPYRVAYSLRLTDGTSSEHHWSGTIRRDPVDRDVLTVADVSCNSHATFPNTWAVASLARLDPDLIAFTGDQFYESSGGYGVQRAPLDLAILDLLRKWFLHGWTWRELTRDRPSVSIPDDHDVYQGNIWGEGGEARHGTQEMGGYDMPPEWVNVVHRTQTSHHPAPYDTAPSKRGISVYFGPLVYGRVSFAILADRQFKSAPEGKVPPTGDRGDHVVRADFDPRTADLPGLELLGSRQIEFLQNWCTDWRGADMKAVISQTIFTAMATTHGVERQRFRADYDANGWPQTARNEALRQIRKAFAFHLAGDQHLPAVVHYGIDAHRDAGVAFAGPAINCIYPRWFEPDKPGENRAAGMAENTGDFRDHFDHPMTVLAVANPALASRPGPLEKESDRAAGLGIVRFDKRPPQGHDRMLAISGRRNAAGQPVSRLARHGRPRRQLRAPARGAAASVGDQRRGQSAGGRRG